MSPGKKAINNLRISIIVLSSYTKEGLCISCCALRAYGHQGHLVKGEMAMKSHVANLYCNTSKRVHQYEHFTMDNYHYLKEQHISYKMHLS